MSIDWRVNSPAISWFPVRQDNLLALQSGVSHCITTLRGEPRPARRPRVDYGRHGGMATLDEIVSAAAKVFRTKGYHAATVRDIADEVGILKGSLYHHFDSKEELLYLVVKEPIAQMYRAIGEIAAAEGTATEKLRRAISAHLEAFDRHYPHLFVYLRER